MQTFKALQESLRSDIAKVAREYPKGKKVKVNNALKYNSLGKSDTVSGEVLDHGKDFLVVGIGKEAFNIKLKDIVKLESVGKDNVEEAKATRPRDFGGKTMPEFEYKNRKGIVGLRPDQYKKSAWAKAADANPNSAAAKAAARGAATRAKMKKEEASSTSPNMAKAVQGLNDLGYKLKGRDGKDVQRVEKLFRSGNKKVLQGAIRALDTDIRDQIMDVLEPLGFVKDGVVEAVDKYTSFSTQNKGRKPSLNQNKLSSAEYQQAKKLKGFNKDDWKYNGDLYIRVTESVALAASNLDTVYSDISKAAAELDEAKKDEPYEKQFFGMGDTRSEKEIRDQISNLSDSTLKIWAKEPAGRFGTKIAKLQDKLVAAEMKKRGLKLKESVEFDESTAAYAASLEKMANDKKLTGITPKDRETLAKLAAMMKGQRG